MDEKVLKSNILLLLTAMIWGFAFVAQRVGMDYVGPFTFNGVRFALGALSLIPVMWFTRRKPGNFPLPPASTRTVLFGGAFAGIALFLGASLQQVGLVYTTAGKAGFITGLYIIIVPIMGLIWRQLPDIGTWIGALLAVFGLYLLSVTESFTIEYGDFLQLIGAFFWASHVHIIAWLSPRIQATRLAFYQYIACSGLSLITAFAIETITLEGLMGALLPICYGGLMSVGIAYTLQVVGQKNAKPAHAAIILSLESVFAAIGGWLLLNETLSARGLVGCALMLVGMILSQLHFGPGFFKMLIAPVRGQFGSKDL